MFYYLSAVILIPYKCELSFCLAAVCLALIFICLFLLQFIMFFHVEERNIDLPQQHCFSTKLPLLSFSPSLFVVGYRGPVKQILFLCVCALSCHCWLQSRSAGIGEAITTSGNMITSNVCSV